MVLRAWGRPVGEREGTLRDVTGMEKGGGRCAGGLVFVSDIGAGWPGNRGAGRVTASRSLPDRGFWGWEGSDFGPGLKCPGRAYQDVSIDDYIHGVCARHFRRAKGVMTRGLAQTCLAMMEAVQANAPQPHFRRLEQVI